MRPRYRHCVVTFAYTADRTSLLPGYEGWKKDADGTKYFLFGYMNRNWEEEPDVPVGAANGFAPGIPDQGQPTHFLPRRNRFVFRVKVPATFSAKDELVWTLTTNGVTEKAYASLRDDYKVDDVVKASETGALGAGSSSPEMRANKPPTVKIDGAAGAKQHVKVGTPIDLAGQRRQRRRRAEAPRSNRSCCAALRGRSARQHRLTRPTPGIRRLWRACAPFDPAMSPPSRITVGKNLGLHTSWFVYRGPAGATVTFDPPQVKPWEDTRAGANSPWAPIWLPPTMPAGRQGASRCRSRSPTPAPTSCAAAPMTAPSSATMM